MPDTSLPSLWNHKLTLRHLTCNTYERMILYFLVMFENIFTKRGLSLDRLRALLEVDAAGSIAGAANGNPVRQSQFSRQLRELETFFGCELTHRDGRYLRLTRRGQDLARLARENLAGLSDFLAECEDRAAQVRISAGESIIRWLLVPSLPQLALGLSGASLDFRNTRTSQAIHQLTEVQTDLAVIRSDAVPRHLESRDIGQLDYALFLPKAFLRRRSQTCLNNSQPSLSQLVGNHPFGRLESKGSFATLQRGSAWPAPSLTTDSLPSLCAAVRTGCCCAVLPALATSELPSNRFLVCRPKEVVEMSRGMSVVWNKRFTHVRSCAAAAVQVLVDELSAILSHLG